MQLANPSSVVCECFFNIGLFSNTCVVSEGIDPLRLQLVKRILLLDLTEDEGLHRFINFGHQLQRRSTTAGFLGIPTSTEFAFVASFADDIVNRFSWPARIMSPA